MIPGASQLGIGPLGSSWLPIVYAELQWPASAQFGNALIMATYYPSPIPAAAFMNDIALSWTVNPEIPTVPVYRCVISSPTLGDLTVPMKNFQGNLKNDGSSFISISIPDVLRWIDKIEPLLVDAGYTVFKGVRFADSSEQLEAIARADYPLRLRSDRGVDNSTITLSGYHVFAVTAAKTRTLEGINYRRSDDGRRAARCRLDEFLRPGDTADVYGELFVVSDINYIVGSGEERMEIQEDPTG